MKKILVVDDEPDVRNTTKTVLKNNGYKVFTANNADQGYNIWKKQKPDLVLMDIMMPGTPVKEIVPKMKDARIVYLSVVRTSEAEREDLLKEKNIIDFIQKPFNIDDLLKKVKKLTE